MRILNHPTRPIWIILSAALLTYGVIACSTSSFVPDELAEEMEKAEEAQKAQERDALEDDDSSGEFAAADEVPMEGVGSDESECLGNLVPPRGAGGRQYAQETAISDTESFETLTERARGDLRDRLCQGVLCGQIEQYITIWEPQQSEGYRCVMAVIEQERFEEWKRDINSDLRQRLEAPAQDVVNRMQEALGNDTLRLTLHEIEDHGVAGGLRAEWFANHLQAALDRASAHVIPLDPSWSGQGIPDRADGVVTARIIPMGGVDDTLEVSWQVESAQRIFSGQSGDNGTLSFPEVIAPDIDRSTYLPPFPVDLDDDEVRLHFDRREGGGLCSGQKTELWLHTVNQDMHVRVINLYGSNQGNVIFPSMDTTDDFIEAGQPVSLGEFEAVQYGDIGVERFLVIASPTREGLSQFESVNQFCRLPSSMAGELQQGYNLPHGDNTYLFETSYRLMDGEECANFNPDKDHLEMVKQAIDAAPSCW